jgi:hypothetical protein
LAAPDSGWALDRPRRPPVKARRPQRHQDTDFVASATFAADRRPDCPAPEEFLSVGSLEPPPDGDRAGQLQVKTREGRVVRFQFAIRDHGTAREIPDFNSEHSH